VTADVGQLHDLEAIGEKAKALGCLKHYSIHAKEEFAQDHVFRSIKTTGLYEEKAANVENLE